MEKSTRNILILIFVLATGATAYYFYDKSKSGKVNLGVTADSKKDTIKFTR